MQTKMAEVVDLVAKSSKRSFGSLYTAFYQMRMHHITWNAKSSIQKRESTPASEVMTFFDSLFAADLADSK